jgi:hypothetical protein
MRQDPRGAATSPAAAPDAQTDEQAAAAAEELRK